MNPRETGVGLTWVPGFESLVEANSGLIDVLEIEPQVLLRRGSPRQKSGGKTRDPKSLELHSTYLAWLQQRSVAKLVHSISSPVGGSMEPHSTEAEPLREVVRKLGAQWLSEHLAFNRTCDEAGSWNAGVLLPPRQTLEGVECAARSTRALSSRMPVPVAIETVVNYLRPRTDELPDGEFVARVAEAADCGILLDLHTVWTNDRNGRQSIGDYLEQLPLERVWEIHLSGGHFYHGFWIDSHDSTVPFDLLELAALIVPRLPNLKAIVFELIPSCVPKIGESAVRFQLEALHRLWDKRNTKCLAEAPVRSEPPSRNPAPSPGEWERTLAALAVQRPCLSRLADEVLRDAGLKLLRELVERSRAAMVVHTLRLTSRLIMLERGTAYFEQLLGSFWREHTPEFCGLDEAEAFTRFLRTCNPYVPFLKEILEYDRAVLAVVLDGEERSISFAADPMSLLSALGAGRRPTEIQEGEFEIRLTPDQLGADASRLAEISVMH